MRASKFIKVLTIPAAALLMTAEAEATITTVDYSFGQPLQGQGTMTLDYDSDTSTYSLNTLHFWIVNAGHFDTGDATLDGSADFYRLYGDPRGSALDPNPFTDDFYFTFNPNLVTQTVELDYHVAGFSGTSFGYVLISRLDANAVPEPASWTMMLIGFGAMGAAVRRRRTMRAIA